MKELVQYAFDFFAHILPGIIILFSVTLLASPLEVTTFSKLFESIVSHADQLNAGSATALVITAYIIGFAINPFGRFLYRKLGPKLWKIEGLQDRNKTISISDKFVLVREYSPNNFKYIETWNIYCAMAHNLAFACLVLLLIGIFKALATGVYFVWGPIVLLAIALFFIFLYRAYVFSIWARNDIYATVESLKLGEKS